MPKRNMLLLHEDIPKIKQYAFTASTCENVWASVALYSLQPSFTDEADETWGSHHRGDHHHHHHRHVYFTMMANKSTIIMIIITMTSVMVVSMIIMIMMMVLLLAIMVK